MAEDERPLAIDLYCGLGGWTEGLLAAGYRVIGFDIEQHVYGEERYPAQLVLQDVRTLHGSQFKNAALIVGSSPCTEFSYMAMPWSRAKAKAAAIRADESGEMLRKLTELFDAQFRIQREACEAAGCHIPMVVENVRGAEPWVGRASWSYGSYYLWGDVPALMPPIAKGARKNPGFRFDGSGRSFQSESVDRHVLEGRKGESAARFNDHKKKGDRPAELISYTSSRSPARKAASAKIAKIPFALSSWIARTYYPKADAA